MSDVDDLVRALSMGRHALPPSAPGEPEAKARVLLGSGDLDRTAWIFHQVQLYDPANTPQAAVTFDPPYWSVITEARVLVEKSLGLMGVSERDTLVLRTAAGVPYAYPHVTGIPGRPGRGLGVFPSWILGYDFVDPSRNTRVRRMFTSRYCSS